MFNLMRKTQIILLKTGSGLLMTGRNEITNSSTHLTVTDAISMLQGEPIDTRQTHFEHQSFNSGQ